MSDVPCLPEPQKILALADEIIGEGLRMVNEPAEDTLTATQVAKTFNMTVFDFNAVLRDMGIQYRRNGRWNISDDLADRNLVRLRTHVSYSLKGEKKIKVYMTWTMDGLRFLNAKLGYPNF
jgi:phage antirepressor YoqD-like protein